MFVCRACARRWLGPPSILAPRLQPSGRARLIPSPMHTQQRLFQRSLNTAVAEAITAPAGTQKAIFEDAMKVAVAKTSNEALDTIVRRVLRYNKDPYNIGKHVEKALEQDKFAEALHVTRTASKDQQVIVSWNHLLNYLLRKERLVLAFKLFNEMKKRAQLPNAQTYTTLFRGCALYPHPDQSVHQATRLYYSMLSRERLKPNTIHMNAVLQVCARAKDIESLFNVAKTANDSLRMPDNMTYTTILNGLRYATVLPHHRSIRVDQHLMKIDYEQADVTISRARSVWEDVVANWRQGRVRVDEELVCAMGRILLLGSKRDNDDILALIEQTMGIPRQDRQPLPLPAPAARAETAASKETPAVGEASAGSQEKTEAETAGGAEEEADVKKSKPAAPERQTQFAPLPESMTVSPSGSGRSKIMYARPGQNTLSLVESSLGKTRKTSLAPRYWDIFMKAPHNVWPDSENWYRLFKTLRRGHASATAVEMLQRMPQELMIAETFRLVMATCLADSLNEKAFANAGKALDMMNRTLRVPDPQTLRLYLQTAISSNRQFRKKTEGDAAEAPGVREAAKLAFGQQLVRALGRLWDPLRLLTNSLSHPSPVVEQTAEPDAGSADGQRYNAQREVMALARHMASAANMVVEDGMAEDAVLKDMRISRNILNRQISRFYEKRDEAEPNLHRQKSGRRSRGPSRGEKRYGRKNEGFA